MLTAEERAAIRERCDAGNLHEALNDLRRALDDIEAREQQLCLRDAILQQAPQAPPLDNFPIDIGWMKSYREWWIGRLRNVDPLECAAKDAEIAALQRGAVLRDEHDARFLAVVEDGQKSRDAGSTIATQALETM